MQMAYEDLNRTPFRALMNKMKGFRLRERDQWEIMRIQTVTLLNSMVDEKDRQQPFEMMPYPWDPEIVKKKTDIIETKKKNAADIWAKIDANTIKIAE